MRYTLTSRLRKSSSVSQKNLPRLPTFVTISETKTCSVAKQLPQSTVLFTALCRLKENPFEPGILFGSVNDSPFDL